LRVIKQDNKDKTQLNIKKYLHNITLKDQDPKVMNKLRVEEDTNTDVKRCANESSVATRRIAGEMFNTQTNFQNHGRTFKLLLVNVILKSLNSIIRLLLYAVFIAIGQSNEYFKLNKDDLNNYFCYDE